MADWLSSVDGALPAPVSKAGAPTTAPADAALRAKSEERQLLEYCGQPRQPTGPVRPPPTAATSAAPHRSVPPIEPTTEPMEGEGGNGGAWLPPRPARRLSREQLRRTLTKSY